MMTLPRPISGRRSNRNDGPLIRRLKRGDEDAFTELVNLYKRRAFSVAYRILNNIEDAKEISQEAFVRVYRSIDRFREDSNFYTWFYRILVNLCMDAKKKKGIASVPFSFFRRNDGSDNQIVETWSGNTKMDGPLDSLLNKELNDKITAAIDALPEKQRTVFILRNYEAMSLKDIAESMHCAEGTVKSHLSRAVRGLRGQLGHVSEQASISGGCKDEKMREVQR